MNKIGRQMKYDIHTGTGKSLRAHTIVVIIIGIITVMLIREKRFMVEEAGVQISWLDSLCYVGWR